MNVRNYFVVVRFEKIADKYIANLFHKSTHINIMIFAFSALIYSTTKFNSNVCECRKNFKQRNTIPSSNNSYTLVYAK